tara:strand:+ start:409 stop:729 length:321 start_codon:yes stop_codon:yes gene_type:complete
MKKLIFTYLFLIFLNSCQSVTEGFKLKENSSDEFLVEKKNPLVLPPNFNELPSPTGESLSLENSTNKDFEIVIKSEKSIESQGQNESKSNSAADMVLKNIKKNDVD